MVFTNILVVDSICKMIEKTRKHKREQQCNIAIGDWSESVEGGHEQFVAKLGTTEEK